MAANANAPVIIKRKKVVSGDGHHGGAWKVAYADFVTAMMAFFMLMWLLNATTEKQRKGIADYFNPTIPVNRISGGGDGAFGGDSVFTKETLARNGTGAASGQSGQEAGSSQPETVLDRQTFSELEQALSGYGGESMTSKNALRHVLTRVTDDGLIVELFDLDNDALFDPGTASPTPVTRELVAIITKVFSLVKNDVAINGHLKSQPVPILVDRTWDLSSARAGAIRLLLEEQGFPTRRVQRVAGFSDRQLFARNPMAARNNRVELVLLRAKR